MKIITPYKDNRDFLQRQIKNYSEYLALAGVEPVATVDSFQGREGDIVIAVLVTTTETGPGFMTNENRLNVLLSRQISGLLIVGDVNIMRQLTTDGGEHEHEDEHEGKGKAAALTARQRKNRRNTTKLFNEQGGYSYLRKIVLRDVLRTLYESGRVSVLEGTESKPKKGKKRSLSGLERQDHRESKKSRA